MPKLDHLRKVISENKGKKAIVVVGAGVTIQTTGNHKNSSWQGLLESGIEYCVDLDCSLGSTWKERMLQALKGDLVDWLSVAYQIENRLTRSNFQGWLEDTIGALPMVDPTLIQAIDSLGATIVTTNYDGLIEKVTGKPTVTMHEPSHALRVLSGDEDGVLHLHGFWKYPDSIVFGVKSYEKIKEDQIVQAFQKSMTLMNNLIFIGFGAGLNDPNFGALLEWSRHTLKGAGRRHFRLALKKDERLVQSEHHSDDRILVIPYGKKYEDLTLFLKELAPKKLNASICPVPPAGFCFGRDNEFKILKEYLLEDLTNPLPVLGMAGIGKSTLTLKVLNDPDIESHFGDNRFFIRCDGIVNAEGLALALGRSILGVICPSGKVIEQIHKHFAQGSNRALIVLDNAETPWTGDQEEVSNLIESLVGLRFINLVASFRGSNRPLRPEWGPAIFLNPLDRASSRKAFLSIARKFEHDKELDKLLLSLDGLPLAIKLMAHHAETAPSLKWIADRWDNEKDTMLSLGNDRATSLEATIELSFSAENITVEEKRFAALLGLLPSGIAHRDISVFSPKGGFKTVHNLVENMGVALHETNRVRMLCPIREYVARSYPLSSEDLNLVLEHYVKVAEKASLIGKKGGAQALEDLVGELPNLEALCIDVPELLGSVSVFNAGLYLTRVLRYTGIGSLTTIEHMLKRAKRTNTVDFARCAWSLGEITLDRGDQNRARRYFNEAFDHYKLESDEFGMGCCIKRMGDIARRRLDSKEAEARFLQAMDIFRKVHYDVGVGNCIYSIANLSVQVGDLDQAELGYKEALAIYQACNDLQGQANSYHSLAEVSIKKGLFEVAPQYLNQALELYEIIGDPSGIANFYFSMGDLESKRGNLSLAKRQYKEALSQYIRLDDPQSIGRAELGLARITDSEVERSEHLKKVKSAWSHIGQKDLLKAIHEDSIDIPRNWHETPIPEAVT